MQTRTKEARSRIRSKLKEEASTKTGRYHVVKSSEGWAVKREGAKRVSKIYRTKAGAIRDVKTYSTFRGVLIVHKRDGSFQEA